MAILFSSNSMTDFTIGRPSDVSMVTATSSIADTNYVTNCIFIDGSVSGQGLPALTWDNDGATTGVFWFHMNYYHGYEDNRHDGHLLGFFDVNGNQIGRIDFVNGDPHAEASADTTESGALVGIAAGSLLTVDVSVEVDASNITVTLYLNGLSVSTATAANTVSGYGTVSKVEIAINNVSGVDGDTSNPDPHISEIIMADNGTSTIDMRVYELVNSADGTYTDWNGAYTEVSDNDTETAISTVATGQKQTWTLTNPTIPSGMDIEAVVTNYRGYIEGAGTVQTFDSLLYINSTDYTTDSITISNTQGNSVVYTVNPDTSSAWTGSDVNSLEVGIRSNV